MTTCNGTSTTEDATSGNKFDSRLHWRGRERTLDLLMHSKLFNLLTISVVARLRGNKSEINIYFQLKTPKMVTIKIVYP